MASLPRGSSETAEATVQSLQLYVGSGVVRGVLPPATDLSVVALNAVTDSRSVRVRREATRFPARSSTRYRTAAAPACDSTPRER